MQPINVADTKTRAIRAAAMRVDAASRDLRQNIAHQVIDELADSLNLLSARRAARRDDSLAALGEGPP
jgi:hypothetical protein